MKGNLWFTAINCVLTKLLFFARKIHEHKTKKHEQ